MRFPLVRAGVLVTIALLSATGTAPARTTPPSKKPTVSVAGPSRATVGTAVSIKLKCNAPKGRKLARFTLSFGDRSKAQRGRKPPTKRIRHTYRQAGTFTVKLTVVDTRGARRSATHRIRVSTSDPTGHGTPTPNPGGTPTPNPGFGAAPPPPEPSPSEPVPDRTPLTLTADAVELVVGARKGVVLPAPLQEVATIDEPAGLPAGVTVSTDGSAVTLAAASDAAPISVEHPITITGKGCTATGGCDHPLTLTVPVTVRGLEAPPGDLAEFTAAGPDRVAAAAPIPQGGKLLQDELLITLGTPDAPGTRAQAESAASAVDGIISGGVEPLGMYEVRWFTAQDLVARRAQLLAQFNVTNVSTSAVGIFSTEAVHPSDWDDDGPAATWPFRVTRATTAWEQTTGGTTAIGIVDEGQAYGHEDLNISKRVGSNGIGNHATHVAGTACAMQNGIGLVGFGWGCPIITSGWNDNSIKGLLQAMTEVANAGAKVINMSLGAGFDAGCAPSQAAQDDLLDEVRQWRSDFRTLMRGSVGRNVIWTLAAGNNCAAGVASPFGLNSDLGNVITVAAINSDKKLSNFSSFGEGVEVAAPGGAGVGDDAGGSPGIWSTTVNTCWVFFKCSSYGVMMGTSMAAPAVAGIAALVREKHPAFGASRAAGCIIGSAGTDGVGSVTERSPDVPWPGANAPFSGTIPIVNAQAAVECESLQFSAGPGTGPPPSTLGGHAMTPFNPDGRPTFQWVDGVPDPAGTIGFVPTMDHRTVPNGWATWSHGYTGDVYFTATGGEQEVEITMPPSTKAFSFYAEPNTFARFTAEAIANDGTSSEPVEIEGNSGATYFGFYGIAGRTVSSITVKASDPQGFAIGEFMISR